MSASERSPFSAEQIAEFHRRQAERPVIFRQITDRFRMFEHCPNKTCRRVRGCQEPRALCFYVMLQAMPDHLRRTFAYAIRNRLNGLSPQEALAQAEARVAVEESTPFPDVSATP